jgi:hypothetical protein
MKWVKGSINLVRQKRGSSTLEILPPFLHRKTNEDSKVEIQPNATSQKDK